MACFFSQSNVMIRVYPEYKALVRDPFGTLMPITYVRNAACFVWIVTQSFIGEDIRGFALGGTNK